MTTPSPRFLQSLRESQARSANEQILFSDRDWLLVAAFVQFLTALSPIHHYLMALRLSLPPGFAAHAPWLIGGLLGLAGSLMLLWWWALYAPYRAALTALLAYIAVHSAIALLQPQAVLDNIASKILVLTGLVLAVRTGWLRRRPQ
ncbi:MAG: hypothetical protein WC661_10425 [Opitutaceae bacterium]|jgi:hypothetical protein